MDEFSLITHYFKSLPKQRFEVVLGIGDDAAILNIPQHRQLLISCDSMVSGVHFLPEWDPHDIAWRAVAVNVSDIVAMGGEPLCLMLSLTMPEADSSWLQRFSEGLAAALHAFNLDLIGGDTTAGALHIGITIQGTVEKGKAVLRSGAKPHDHIWVSGELGGAAQAVALLHRTDIPEKDRVPLMEKLLHPQPRLDLCECLQTYASAAIDISDGLVGDLTHICEASGAGASLVLERIPIHPLVRQYQGKEAVDFALQGGDDYEICFTVPPDKIERLQRYLAAHHISSFWIGTMDVEKGLRGRQPDGKIAPLENKAYRHF